MKLLALASFTLFAATSVSAAANLVTNGNFESGNTGFASAYNYVAPTFNAGYPQGVYTVDTNPSNVHDLWVSMGDHTTGRGNFLIVNGASTPTLLWEQTISGLVAGENYFFEAFGTNVCCSGFSGTPSTFTFTIEQGASVSTLRTFTSSTTPGIWQGFSNTYLSNGSGSAVLRIFNNSTAFGGNDFGVDDINFSTQSVVPEPATWAMLIIGFGLVGSVARRSVARTINA
jgi:hypothetical protein